MSKMYEISYTETLSGTFTVEADSPEEAKQYINFSDLVLIDSNAVVKEVFDPSGLVDGQEEEMFIE